MGRMSQGPSRADAILRRLPAALFVAIPLLLVLPALRRGVHLFGHDVQLTFYYLHAAVGRALAEGRLPVWGPETMCGAPTLAAIQAAALYPGTWLAALTGPGLFWTLSAALHLSLSGFFAEAWLRRGLGLGRPAATAGALAFMLSGFVVTHLHAGHVTLIACYPWAAAILWRLERFLAGPTLRRAATLALPLAMMILAGFPQAVMIAGVAVLCRLIHVVASERERIRERSILAGRAAAALFGGVLLAAPQLLPTLELLGHVQRTALKTEDFAGTYALAPHALPSLLVPTFFGDARGTPYWGPWYLWETAGFLGLSTLALAAFALGGRHPQRRLWAATAVLGLLAALGPHTPVFPALTWILPGSGLFRAPGRFLLLFTIATVPLAAMGLERLLRGDETSRRHALRAGLAAAVLAVAGVGYRASLGPERWASILAGEAERAKNQREEAPLRDPGFPEASRATARAGLAWAALCLSMLAASMALHRWKSGPGPAAAAGFLLAAELLVVGQRYFVAEPETDARWPASFVESVRRHPDYPFRIATVTDAQTPAIGKCQLAGLETVGGYDPMMLNRYAELTNAGRGWRVDELVVVSHAGQPGPIFDLLGARYWILPIAETLPPGWRVAAQFDSNYVYENPRALPRLFLVTRAVVIESREDRLRAMADLRFDPSLVAVLESGRGLEGNPSAKGVVRLRSRAAGFYEADVECPAPSILVLSESWYPGWSAEVDGAPADLLRVDHLVQGVALPPGMHRVRFSYRPGALMRGFAVAALALLAPAVLVLVRRRRAAAAPTP